MKKNLSARHYFVKSVIIMLIMSVTVVSCKKQAITPAVNSQTVSSATKTKVPPPILWPDSTKAR